MNTKTTIKKSDVGLTETQLTISDLDAQKKDFETLQTDISLYNKYTNLVTRIKNSMNDVLSNYISIGIDLEKIDNNKSYVVGGFENLYDLAKVEFGLSETTVRNAIAIAQNFTDDRGYLKDEFKGFSFSQLTELLSVDALDLKNYKPVMSVKEIRSKKYQTKILKKYSDILDQGLIKTYLDYIENFDYNKYLKTTSFVVSYQIEQDSTLNITNKYKQLKYVVNFSNKITKQKFKVSLVLSVGGLRFDNCSLNGVYLYHKIENIDGLEQSLIKLCNEMLSNIKSEAVDDLKKPIKELKKHQHFYKNDYYSQVTDSIIDLNTDDEPIFKDTTKNDSRILAFTFDEIISKNNHPQIRINGLSDTIFSSTFEVLKEIVDDKPVYVEDELMQQALTAFEVSFKDFIKRTKEAYYQNKKDSQE